MNYVRARWGEFTSILASSGAAGVLAAYLLGKIDGQSCIAGLVSCALGYLMPETKKAASAIVLMVGLTFALSACAGFDAAWSGANNYYAGQLKATVGNIQGVNDNAAQSWADAGCATPYGELVRNGTSNPNLPAAIMQLCGAPAGFTVIHTAAVATAMTTVPTTTVSVPPAAPAPAPTTPAPAAPGS